MAKQLVIFDCDGVLFRSEDANLAFYNEVMQRLGQPRISDQDQSACHALASAQLFDRIFSGRQDLRDRARAIARSLDYGPYYELMSPQGDLYEVLDALCADYRLAMATNRGKTAAEVVKRFALTPYIELTVGALDVAYPKPHPDMLERCLGFFGVEREKALYVGDQQIDADAAASAGVPFVAMGAAVTSASHRIHFLSDLLELVPLL